MGDVPKSEVLPKNLGTFQNQNQGGRSKIGGPYEGRSKWDLPKSGVFYPRIGGLQGRSKLKITGTFQNQGSSGSFQRDLPKSGVSSRVLPKSGVSRDLPKGPSKIRGPSKIFLTFTPATGDIIITPP